MTYIWKVIMVFNLLMSCIAMYLLYDRLTYNPYDSVGNQISDIHTDINQLNADMEEMKQDLEGIGSDVIRR